MQAGTTSPTSSESIGSLINAVSLLVGAVVPMIVASLSYVKARSHDPKINEALDTGIAVGKLATATANKALENKESIKSALQMGLSVVPQDQQQVITQKQTLIDQLTKEISATSAQINQLKPMIPGKANADTITNLPREKDF